MSNYKFEIRECENGWLLSRQIAIEDRWEYFPTLNELFFNLLEYVDEDFPKHRNTGLRIHKEQQRDE